MNAIKFTKAEKKQTARIRRESAIRQKQWRYIMALKRAMLEKHLEQKTP